ncbi:hypothetical protein QIH01_27455 [Brevibacillus brevis]|nr:hypothetical protein QIH01_27455 [Brevibacillus brevis]
MVSFCKKVMMVVLGLMMAIGSLAGHALFAGSTAHAASTDNNWSQVSKAGIEGAQYATLLNANETLYIAYADSNQGGRFFRKSNSVSVFSCFKRRTLCGIYT